MTDYITIAYAWIIANPHIVVPLVVYIAFNVIPRTPPANRQLFALWAIVERFMFLGWEKWGGPAKLLGIVSPNPLEWADEAATKKEGKHLP